MTIHRIAGPAGSGKTSRINALKRKFDLQGERYLEIDGNATVSGVLALAEASASKIIIIDECSPRLLGQLEAAVRADITYYVAIQTQAKEQQ